MVYSKPEMLSMTIDQTKDHAPLVCALIQVLSEWQPATVNHSPEDYVPYVNEEPEQLGTYGLMQFTGRQARESGYKGKLSDLIDPPVNLGVGIAVLRDALSRTPKLESGLTIYLGRARANLIPAIVGLISAYEKLLAERPS